MLHPACTRHFRSFTGPAIQTLFPVQNYFRQFRRLISISAKGIPPGSWDSHMHVTDPERFPISGNATYQPHAAPLVSALANARALNLPNLVFIQPSTYGTDNSCLLEALKTVGPSHGRGVVAVDPKEVSSDTLHRWHTLGVRGVRLNLKSIGKKLSKDELVRTIETHAELVRTMKTWVLQLYIDLSEIEGIEHLFSDLNIKTVLDHYGSPSATRPSQIPEWHSLLRIMQSPCAYVKISAPYRLSKDPEYKDLESITKELFKVRNGKCLVFASDWPHTRFEGVSVNPFIERCLEWCDHDENLKNHLFRDNAKELWDVKDENFPKTVLQN